MIELLTPGVTYERVDATDAVAGVRMDVAGFVGIARQGPIDTPMPIESWRQFEAVFGSFTGSGYLAYALRAFFENGGRRCWVVRVASEAVASAGMDVPTQFPLAPAGPGWRIEASSPGVWGNELSVELRETHRAQTLSVVSPSAPRASAVLSVTGFARGAHVQLSQDGAATQWKVVSDVDATHRLLIWHADDPVARLPYDAPLTGFDPNRPILIESVESTLLVRRLGRLIRTYAGLSLVPQNAGYGPNVLRGALSPGVVSEPVRIRELRAIDPLPAVGIAPLVPHAGYNRLTGGADGLAALGTYDFIGEPISPYDSDEVVRLKRRGLRAMEGVDEVALLAVPDINIRPLPPALHAARPPCLPDPCLPAPPPADALIAPSVGDLPPIFSEADVYRVQAAMVEQCERLQDRIALIDPPFDAARDDALGSGAIRAWRQRFESAYAALYYPWVRVVDPLRSAGALTRDVPPCGHIAGEFARAEQDFGAHRAPANLTALAWAQDLTAPVNDATHAVLNPDGINAMRVFGGRGIRIFGARTLSSDPNRRYVNVRRVILMIRKAIRLAIQWATFEPNDESTWAKLRLVLSSFLLGLWERGGLAGATPEEAFIVRCDDVTNPPLARDRGQLLALIGVAPSVPLEFIVLRVGRTANQFEVSEILST